MTGRFFDTNILAYLASADARKADIAQELLAQGIVLKDSAQGTTWEASA